MRNKIYAPSRFRNKQINKINVNPAPKINFGADKVIQKTDKIEDRENKSTKYPNKIKFLEKFNFMNNHNFSNNLNLVLLGATGTSFTLLAMNRYRLGKVLKSLGKNLPLSLKGRLLKVSSEAMKDGLTGLFNKAHLEVSINKAFTKAVKNGKDLSVGFVDIDYFKCINENLGHETGDLFIKKIAEALQTTAKEFKAEAYRNGGEEFVIVGENLNASTLKKITETAANRIGKNKELQSYLPGLKEKISDDIRFLSETTKQLDFSIFPKLRGKQDSNKVANEIILIIENYIKKYAPSNSKILNEIISGLKVPKINNLSTNTKFGESTLGTILDNICIQCKEKLSDSTKWFNHLAKYGEVTISGGVVDLEIAKGKAIDGLHLIKMADLALNSVKENGRNAVRIADEEIIKAAA